MPPWSVELMESSVAMFVRSLKRERFWVRWVDFRNSRKANADDFVVGDLRDQRICGAIVGRRFDEVHQLAADMGGPGFLKGEHERKTLGWNGIQLRAGWWRIRAQQRRIA
jgi:hypothetical protein